MISIAHPAQTQRLSPACRLRRYSTKRTGTSAIEAAVVLPLLALLLLACSDIGRALHAQIVVSNVARVGAEYGATHRFTDDTRSAWEARLRNVMNEELLSLKESEPELLDAIVTMSQLNADEFRIEVSATYPFQMLVAWPGFPSSLDLTHSVTMRQYQ
jgi:Flp pilus assembly protein TadG